ncbi:MAG: F0F1 ATP synthase subunit gamma [Microthrixaceae bacterium]|nr:F0F1 ATP synthase subunit gamma [Microthrixaceae bacterium]
MPGAQERVLRRRIGAFQNMKKITRAMELIAATRVVKAVQAAGDARPYSEHITHVITDLASAGAAGDHPLLSQPEQVRTVGVVVFSSDRGLAGAYNSSVIRAAEREVLAAKDAGQGYVLITVGKKAEAYFRFRGYQVHTAYNGFTEKPTYEHAREIAAEITSMFGESVDEVRLAYTRFVSMGTQEVSVRRFLPLETGVDPASAGAQAAQAQFEFEPSPSAVLAALLPRYVESRLFAALLDAAASELASRQRAMKSATDNAQELILKLSRKMNQARQEAITTEIMEIIGGAEALAADQGDDEDLLLDHLFSDPFPALMSDRQFTNIRTKP